MLVYHQRQQGIVLVVTLIALVLTTSVGLAAAQSARIEALRATQVLLDNREFVDSGNSLVAVENWFRNWITDCLESAAGCPALDRHVLHSGDLIRESGDGHFDPDGLAPPASSKFGIWFLASRTVREMPESSWYFLVRSSPDPGDAAGYINYQPESDDNSSAELNGYRSPGVQESIVRVRVREIDLETVVLQTHRLLWRIGETDGLD